MGEIFKGDFNPFGHYYEDSWDNQVSDMRRDVASIVGKFDGKPSTPEVIYQLSQAVDAYFATQCFVSAHAVDITAFATFPPVEGMIQYNDVSCRFEYWDGEVWVPFATSLGLQAIVDCHREGLDFGEDYTIDYTLGDYTMDEALEATVMADTSDSKQEKKTTRAEDVLFEPIDLEADRKPKPPQPVYDDHGCYD